MEDAFGLPDNMSKEQKEEILKAWAEAKPKISYKEIEGKGIIVGTGTGEDNSWFKEAFTLSKEYDKKEEIKYFNPVRRSCQFKGCDGVPNSYGTYCNFHDVFVNRKM